MGRAEGQEGRVWMERWSSGSMAGEGQGRREEYRNRCMVGVAHALEDLDACCEDEVRHGRRGRQVVKNDVIKTAVGKSSLWQKHNACQGLSSCSCRSRSSVLGSAVGFGAAAGLGAASQ